MDDDERVVRDAWHRIAGSDDVDDRGRARTASRAAPALPHGRPRGVGAARRRGSPRVPHGEEVDAGRRAGGGDLPRRDLRPAGGRQRAAQRGHRRGGRRGARVDAPSGSRWSCRLVLATAGARRPPTPTRPCCSTPTCRSSAPTRPTYDRYVDGGAGRVRARRRRRPGEPAVRPCCAGSSTVRRSTRRGSMRERAEDRARPTCDGARGARGRLTLTDHHPRWRCGGDADGRHHVDERRRRVSERSRSPSRSPPPERGAAGAGDDDEPDEAPTLANTDSRRTESTWPWLHGAGSLASAIDRRSSKLSSQVRQRYS